MARYSYAVNSITPTATGDTANLANSTYLAAVQGGSGTQQLKINEVYMGGEAASSSSPTVMVLARDSTVGTGSVSGGYTALLDASATAPGTLARNTITNGTTLPQRSSTLHLLHLSYNAYGGIVRWVARPGEEITVVGNTASLGEVSLSAFTGGTPGQMSSHIIYELEASAVIFASATWWRPYPQVEPPPNALLGTLHLVKPTLPRGRLLDWPVPLRDPRALDYLTLDTVSYMPAVVPSTQVVRDPTFAPGFKPTFLTVDQPPNNLVTLAAIHPFPPIVFGHSLISELYQPIGYRYFDQSWWFDRSLEKLLPPVTPRRPTDTGTPMPARATPQDWIWSGETTRGIPTSALHTTVGRFYDWPTPMPRQIVQADSYSQPHILQILPIYRPFQQNDWPNPWPRAFFTEGLPSLNRYAFLPPPTVLYAYTLGQAIQILATAGFTVDPVIIWQYSATVPYYYVISQLPVAGDVINYQSIPIQLTVSAGPAPPSLQTVAVPNLLGLPQLMAMEIISATSLNLGVTSFVLSPTIAINTVTAQSPAPGTEVEPYSAINLTICSGPQQDTLIGDPYTIPNVSSLAS
jgi:hypothetical protein